MFLKKLNWYRQATKQYWQQYFKSWQHQTTEISPLATQLLTKFTNLYPRGKQIRGFLAYLGYKIGGGQNDEQILKASISLEILETSILSIDDVFDQDKKRRGVDALHISWLKELKQNSNAKFLGENMATISTLNGYFMVVENLLQTTFKPKIINKALQFLSKAAILTGYGEAMDILGFEFNYKHKHPFRDLDKISYYKTSWYTIIMPLKFGLYLAEIEESNDLHENLYNYGKQIGQLFQIKDDLLGSFGNSQKTGKSNRSDILQRRWTSLMRRLYTDIKSEDKSQFLDIFKDEMSVKKEVMLRQLLKSYDIADKLNRQMYNILKSSQILVNNLECASEYRQILNEFSQFLFTRDH